MRIDLNADLGESDADRPSDVDVAVMSAISSVSVAAGAHAGSAALLRETIALAKARGVAVGAHPSFLDREYFGRRDMHLPPWEVEALVAAQVGAVADAAEAAGVRLQHVKPHGALYNMAARDETLARAVCSGVRRIDPALIVFGPFGSALLAAALADGLAVASEVFADRAYRPDGSLVSRSESGAVILDATRVAARAVRFAAEQTVEAIDGSVLRLRADTVCLHGDTPGAARLAESVREALVRRGVAIRAVGDR